MVAPTEADRETLAAVCHAGHPAVRRPGLSSCGTAQSGSGLSVVRACGWEADLYGESAVGLRARRDGCVMRVGDGFDDR